MHYLKISAKMGFGSDFF